MFTLRGPSRRFVLSFGPPSGTCQKPVFRIFLIVEAFRSPVLPLPRTVNDVVGSIHPNARSRAGRQPRVITLSAGHAFR